MAKGPSPLIPLLLVLTLVLLLYGHSLVINTISLVEDLNFTFFILIPLLAIFLLYNSTQSIILPLSFILLSYTFSKILVVPLVLVIIIYLTSFYSSFFQGNRYKQSRVYEYEDEFGGWGWLLLVLIFFVCQVMSFKVEGNAWGFVVVVVIFFFLYNCFSD